MIRKVISMNFRDLFSKRSVRQLLFVVFLFALLFPMAIWDSNTQVKVNFQTEKLNVYCDQYSMSIPYADIASAEVADLAEAGEKVENGYDNDIVRCGQWQNDVWGEYYICADLDTTNCVVLHLQDGRTFVFSCKDNATTAKYCEDLLLRLS